MPVRDELGLTAAVLTPADFWRSGATNVAGALPDGVTDTTDKIHREGRVAVQNALGAVPEVATPPLFEIANGGRSGTDYRNGGDPFYATGALHPGSTDWLPVDFPSPETVAKAFIGHSNQTQGFLFGYQTIKKHQPAGVAGGGNFILNNDGNVYSKQYNYSNGAMVYDMHVKVASAPVNDAQGFEKRWYAQGTQVAIDLLRLRSAAGALQGGTIGWERFHQLRRPDGAFVNHSRESWSFRNPNISTYQFNPNNQLGDQLIQMWGDTTTQAAFYGFGMRGSEMTAWITDTARFVFRVSNGAPVDRRLFVVNAAGVGDVVIDPDGQAVAGWANGLYRFGGETSDTGIKSQRQGAGRFLNAIEFYTEATLRFAIRSSVGATGPARIFIRPADVPTFASNAAALAAGCLAGDIFKDALGGLHIVL
jgi:hypothetical protein